MICNLCKIAGDYNASYKDSGNESDAVNAERMHWYCINSPRNNGSCLCGHRVEEIKIEVE